MGKGGIALTWGTVPCPTSGSVAGRDWLHSPQAASMSRIPREGKVRLSQMRLPIFTSKALYWKYELGMAVR